LSFSGYRRASAIGLFLEALDRQLEEVSFLRLVPMTVSQGTPPLVSNGRITGRAFSWNPNLSPSSSYGPIFRKNVTLGQCCPRCLGRPARALYAVDIPQPLGKWSGTFDRNVLMANFRNGYIPKMALAEGVDEHLLEDSAACISGWSPTLAINTVMERTGNRRLDAIFVDVEGYDLAVLRMLNLDELSLRLSCMRIATCRSPNGCSMRTPRPPRLHGHLLRGQYRGREEPECPLLTRI